MQLCKGKKANDNWVFVLNFSTIVPPGGRQTLHPYQLVLKSMCLSYFFLQCIQVEWIIIPMKLFWFEKFKSIIFEISFILADLERKATSLFLDKTFKIRPKWYVALSLLRDFKFEMQEEEDVTHQRKLSVVEQKTCKKCQLHIIVLFMLVKNLGGITKYVL